MSLKVASIRIKNVLGVAEAEIEPGAVTLLEGANGTNKTSIVAAVQAALGGGGLARLSRVDPIGGETEPEIVLVLDGESGESFRVERNGEGVRVLARVGDTAAFEDVPKPQTWLDGLYDGAGANPVKFLTSSDKERVLLLLEALPLALDVVALAKDTGLTDEEMLALPLAAVDRPFETLELVREELFRRRTGVNRDLKGKAEAAEQLKRNIPAKPASDLRVEAERLSTSLEAETAALARDDEAASAEFRAAEAKVKTETATKETEVWSDFEAAEAELRAGVEARIAEMRDAVRVVVEKAARDRASAINAARAMLDAHRAELESRRARISSTKEDLAAIRIKLDEQARARGLSDQAALFERQATELAEESERLSAAINGVDAHRRLLAASIPVKGLEIDGKTVKLNGLPFDQVNAAERVRAAVAVACLRAKGRRLPIVFVDGAEALDTAHFAALVKELEANGVQAFVAAVRDHELKVRSA